MSAAGTAFLGTLFVFISLPLSRFAYNVTDKPNNGYFEFIVSGLGWSLAFLTIAQGILLLLRGQWVWDFLMAPVP